MHNRKNDHPALSLRVLTLGALVALSCNATAQTIACAHDHGLDAATDDALLHEFRHGAARLPMCFPEVMTRTEMQRAIDEFGMRPPALLHDMPDPRFFLDAIVWNGAAGFAPNGEAAPASLTISFPDDGVQWGLAAIHAPSVGPNELSARFIGTFGSVDRGREHVRQAYAAWQHWTGLSFREVPDDNSPMDASEVTVPWRGDLRIGSANATGAPFIAYNAFPTAGGIAGVGGGDMFIAANRFNVNNFNNPSNDYRYFRNTVAHEIGHGVGLIHVVPCNGTKLMEPQISTGFDMVAIDDLRGGVRAYGDRFAGNHTMADAHDFGDLAPVPGVRRTVSEPRLALNGANGPNNTHTDWFTFRMSEADVLNIFVNPVGGTYNNGQQTSGCTGTTTSVNASAAGDILIELLDLGTGVSWIANNLGPGGNEFIFTGLIGPTTFALRVTDIGPNAHQIVQLYDLLIFPGASSDPEPTAVAGIDKRCRANEPCWFMGHLNSRSNDPNNPLSVLEWDFTNDGVFDAFLNPPTETPFLYPSSGDYTVTLRVTDAAGRTATDQMIVTVHGGVTALSQITPNTAYRGETVTAIVHGVNFNIPTGFTLSGSGWTASSLTPADPLGLTATVTIMIDPQATPGLRAARADNTDGIAHLNDAFEILVCNGDTNGDLVIDFTDLGAVLGSFGVCAGDPGYNPAADLNFDNCVDFDDLAIVLGAFGTTCP